MQFWSPCFGFIRQNADSWSISGIFLNVVIVTKSQTTLVYFVPLFWRRCFLKVWTYQKVLKYRKWYGSNSLLQQEYRFLGHLNLFMRSTCTLLESSFLSKGTLFISMSLFSICKVLVTAAICMLSWFAFVWCYQNLKRDVGCVFLSSHKDYTRTYRKTVTFVNKYSSYFPPIWCDAFWLDKHMKLIMHLRLFCSYLLMYVKT